MGNDLKCFKIDEECGCAIHYMAARHHGEALNTYLELTGGDTDAETFAVTLIDDTKVPQVKVQDSAEEGDGDDLSLIECLARARAQGRAQLLSTTEF